MLQIEADFLADLRCPVCRGPVQPRTDGVACVRPSPTATSTPPTPGTGVTAPAAAGVTAPSGKVGCGVLYPLKDGILVMLEGEAVPLPPAQA